MRYPMRGITLRNTKFADKPNEDLYRTDEETGAVLLLDGVSRDRENGRYPVPSPSLAASEAFAGAAFIQMRRADGQTAVEKLKCAVEAGNRAVFEANHGFEGYFLPGTVGILALVEGGALHYAYIGDCCGAVLGAEGLRRFTSAQTEEVHRRRDEFTSREIRANICNNINHPCGYGVWNGSGGAADFLRTGTVMLREGERVLLFTDGFAALFEGSGAQRLFNVSTPELLCAAQAFDAGGPMDDRTLVVIG